MEQLFYAPDIAAHPVLSEDESQHCVRVLRMKEGDEIVIADGKGNFFVARLDEAHPKRCRVTVVAQQTQLPRRKCAIHLAVAPVKQFERIEWMVEKAIEIGVDAISFVRCRRSERHEVKLARIHRIAVSAMKQSQQAFLPAINDMVDFRSFVAQPFDGCRMIAHCDGGKDIPGMQDSGIGSSASRKLICDVYGAGSPALILIGPEGDFDSDEVASATAHGFTAVSLGHNRLRTETAAIVACHTFHVLNRE